MNRIPGFARIVEPPYNVLITGIDSGAAPRFWNGARLTGVYSLSMPLDGQSLAITATRYGDVVDVAVVGCAREVPHVERLSAFLEQSLFELETSG